MDTDRLRFFCTIVETGSLTAAAEILHISHSGLSKAIRSLEVSLAVKLFRPQGRGLEVTLEGKEVYVKAQAVLEAVADLRSPACIQAPALRIGVPEVFAVGAMGGMIEALGPAREIEILYLNPGELETAIRSGKLDLGITFVPFPQEGVEYVKMARLRMGVFSGKGAFMNTPVGECPFAVPATSLPQNALGITERDGWPDASFPRKKRYRVSLLATALDLAAKGRCVVFIPCFLASGRSGLVELEPPKGMGRQVRDVYLVKRKSERESPLMRQIARAVRALAASD